MKSLSKYFSLRELTFSKIAEDNNIDNTPTPEILEKLKHTASQLDKVRELLGKPVNISSGYRCLQVNRRLGSNKVTENQEKFLQNAANVGFAVSVCYSANEAIKRIEDYYQ